MEKQEKPSEEILEKWSKDPKNWIWGVFYFNPEDPRLLPPKRIQWMGWTVNFANPRSIIAFLIAIAFFILVVTLIEPKK